MWAACASKPLRPHAHRVATSRFRASGQVTAQMEVANAEVKLLEERLHATEKGAFLSLARIAGETQPNRLPGLCGARSSALKDIAAQTDEVRKRMADKVRPPTPTLTPACSAKPLTLVCSRFRVFVWLRSSSGTQPRPRLRASSARLPRTRRRWRYGRAVCGWRSPHPTPPHPHPTPPTHPTPPHPNPPTGPGQTNQPPRRLLNQPFSPRPFLIL